MATPFLALNYRDGTAPKAKRYANCAPGDPVSPGVTFGALDTTAFVNACCDNRIVQFGGERTFVALTRDAIFRTTDGGLSWTSVKTLLVPSVALASARSGLWVIDVGNIPTICCFYLTTTNNVYRAVTSQDGITWSDVGPFTPGTALGTAFSCVSQVVYNNSIYAVFSGTSAAAASVLSFSPGAGSMATIQLAAVGSTSSTFAPWRNSLYLIYKTTSAAAVGLYDITAGSLTLVATLNAATQAQAAGARMADGFVDPATGDLICVTYEGVASGWRVFRVSPTFGVTLISGTTLPFALTGSGAGNSPATSRIRVLVDQESMPGGTPGIYLFYSPDGVSGTPMTMYRWQGVSAVMTVEDSGGNTADSLGICHDNDGGSYTWSLGEKHIKVDSWASTPGGVRFTFTLWSASGTDVVKIRAFTRRDALQSRCATPAEVMNPSAGALSGTGVGNFNTGLVADNGTTTYLLTVNLSGIGFSLVERGRVILDAVDP